VTEQAKEIASQFPEKRTDYIQGEFGIQAPRVPMPNSFQGFGEGKQKIAVWKS
jgi:hypothetical protein